MTQNVETGGAKIPQNGIDQLFEKEQAEWLSTISELEKKFNKEKMLKNFCDSRTNYYLARMREIEKQKGAKPVAQLSQMMGLLRNFYDSGDHINWWGAWLLNTPEEHRPYVVKLISTLHIIELIMREISNTQSKTDVIKAAKAGFDKS